MEIRLPPLAGHVGAEHQPGDPLPEGSSKSTPKLGLTLDANRAAIRDLVRHHRARNPRLFGSVLHGTATAESDLDVLVDALPNTTLFDLGGLQVALEELLGVSVDLLTPEDLAPNIREAVLAEAVSI